MSILDHSLYTQKCDNKITILSLYVDDIVSKQVSRYDE